MVSKNKFGRLRNKLSSAYSMFQTYQLLREVAKNVFQNSDCDYLIFMK